MEENKSEMGEAREAETLTLENEGDGRDKKIKNLISLVILLAGLLVGSIFVDFVQMLKGGGFSDRIVSQTDVIETGGKTWVAFNEPMVRVDVLTDATCEKCLPDDVLVSLKKVIPTMVAKKNDISEESAKKMAELYSIKTLPAFIFSKEVEETDFYVQAKSVMDAKDNSFVLNSAAAGLPVGKYLEIPTFDEGDIKIGSSDAPVKIVQFSDFQCPYCKLFHAGVKKALEEYGDKIFFVYKHSPLSFHAQAENAALASECANEQGKFLDYGNRLFDKQDDWGKSTGTQKFKEYARLSGLNANQFNDCLDSKKYADKVAADKKQSEEFGISGTPATFINQEFVGGILDTKEDKNYEELKKIIDAELAK